MPRQLDNVICFAVMVIMFATASSVICQPPTADSRQKVRTMTVPISIFTKKELESEQSEELIQADRLIVHEDNEEQTILSIRSVTNTPLAIQILIQDDLEGNINLKLPEIAKFIRQLPRGSKVMVGYIRGGSIQVRQKFTDDLEKAAKSLRIVGGTIASANGPYAGLSSALAKFDGLPAGRRAVILFSDGLDASQGITGFGPSQSIELENAIIRAQRRSVALYPIYSPGQITSSGSARTVLAAQGALIKVADSTGGRAFFGGSIAPLSFEPFFKTLGLLLGRQFALTYLSTHMKKGFHRVEITSTNPEVKIEHPKGYFYR
jgi:VWFA-related protein